MGVLPWMLLCSLILPSLGEGIHLPLQRKEVRRRKLGRRSGTGVAGLGDDADYAYSVLVNIGNVAIPVLVDTGSSDLWSVSDACLDCDTDLPVYPQSRFQSADIPIELQYGDSFTGTYADGEIGTDTVTLAGLSESKQYFAAVTDTNTSVTQSGASGIFGLGFPINSLIWSDTFKNSQNDRSSSGLTTRSNHRRKRFPNLSDLYPSKHLNPRQSSLPDSEVTNQILASWSTTGPLIPRLASSGGIPSPMYSIALQRETIDIGGNLGQLSIGSLPSGIQNSSMTWVPLRFYPESDTGLSPPTASPNETYPITWEVFIDGVYLDGQKLPSSQLASSAITNSALVDTGNSLIRGPQDVLNVIYEKIGADSEGVFACEKPHTLGFEIGGVMFSVDPRDFISQAYPGDTNQCIANLAVTDTPTLGGGYLNTWSLGDPFLKGVVSAYYFGNITYPSRDPPRMGFLSTVPSDANDKYQAAIQSAGAGGNLPLNSVPAPSVLASATATDSNGVAAATLSPSSGGGGGSGGSRAGSFAAPRFSTPGIWVSMLVVLGGIVMC